MIIRGPTDYVISPLAAANKARHREQVRAVAYAASSSGSFSSSDSAKRISKAVALIDRIRSVSTRLNGS